MIRIAVDARPLAHIRTGIGQYTYQLLKRLIAEDDLEILLYSQSPVEISEFQDTANRYSSSKRVSGTLFAQTTFVKWSKSDQVDAFWSPRHHLPLFLSCPSVLTIHDLVWRNVPETMIKGGMWAERLLMPPSVRKASKIICVSNSTRNDLLLLDASAAAKTSVIYEASDLAPTGTETLSPRARPFFLFVGTKEPRKNIENLLLAWRSASISASFDLILAGGTGWKFDVPSALLNLPGVVSLSPNRSELASLYQQCKALVLPSLYEGFGLPLVEAMTFGKPIITSNVSSLPEIAGDAAILVSPKDPGEIAQAIVRLAEDVKLAASLAERSKARSREFSWDRAASETAQVLRSVSA